MGLRLLILLLLLLPGVALAQSTPAPGENTLAECVRLLPTNRPMPSGPDAPTLRIVQPAADATIYGGTITVSIQTNNFDVDAQSGRHWHLWVNDQLRGMVYQDDAVLDLEPGTYRICASLGNTDHADMGMPDGIVLTIEEPLAGTPTATLAVSREQATIQPEATSPDSSQLILLVAGGLLAAVGGWWIGSRMPKQRKAKSP